MWSMVIAVIAGAGTDAGTRPVPQAEVIAVRVELAQMVALDQSYRRSGDPRVISEALRTVLRPAYQAKYGDIDVRHTERLKKLFAKYGGWIRSSVFGGDAAHDAWLLLQHADHDRAFQKRMLPVLEAASLASDASGVDVAYLTDRVLVAENLPQRYGTQGRCVDKGKWEHQLVEAPERLDERRKALGLEPEADYAQQLHPRCTRNEDLPQAVPDAGK